MKKTIPNCVPEIAGNETKYLTDCIETRWLSPVGPYVDRFETDFAAYHGVEVATAVCGGTAAIHLGLLALGVQPGEIVLSPDMTFVGGVNPIRYCGAEPIFLGVEERSLNLDPEVLREFLATRTTKTADGPLFTETGQRIAALVVVHLYGIPAEMDPIMSLAEEYGFPVLEDAAESLGARYRGRLVGTIGDVGCFSFNGNKVITSGGGGMVIARDPEKTRFCKHLSTQAKCDKFEFIHDHIGFNYRLSNLCAAAGVAQMEALNTFIERKQANFRAYAGLLEGAGVELVDVEEDRLNTYWMTLARIRDGSDNLLDRLRELAASGVGVRPVWYPLHLMPLYEGCSYFGRDAGTAIYRSTFCLPSSVGLSDEDIAETARVVRALVRQGA